MEIKSIKLKSKNNTNIFVAETDGGFFDLHSEVIVKLGIKTGVVADDVFKTAVLNSQILIATEKAMKYIASKLKTQQQVKDYIYKQGYHADVVNPVVAKLDEYKLLNDAQFVKSYIASNKNFSANKLKQKLLAFGVKSALVEEFLPEVNDFSSCKSHAQKFLKNKPQDAATYQKLVRHLLNKGYGFETIKAVLNQLKLQFDAD